MEKRRLNYPASLNKVQTTRSLEETESTEWQCYEVTERMLKCHTRWIQQMGKEQRDGAV